MRRMPIPFEAKAKVCLDRSQQVPFFLLSVFSVERYAGEDCLERANVFLGKNASVEVIDKMRSPAIIVAQCLMLGCFVGSYTSSRSLSESQND